MEKMSSNKYVAGWNTPGYLPEMEPQEFDSAHDAVGFLCDAVHRFWDEDYDSYEDWEGVDAKWLPIHTDLHNGSSTSDSLNTYTSDNSLVFWFHPVE